MEVGVKQKQCRSLFKNWGSYRFWDRDQLKENQHLLLFRFVWDLNVCEMANVKTLSEQIYLN